MPEFKLVLIISNDDHREVPYFLNLTGIYEDYPEDYFRVEANRIKMQAALQEKAERKVDSFQLKPIIDKWIREIKEGRRRTTIRLDLPAEAPEPIPDPPMAKSTPADIVTSEYKIIIPNNIISSNNTSTPEFRQTASAATSTLENKFHPRTQIGTNISNSVPPKPQEPENQPPSRTQIGTNISNSAPLKPQEPENQPPKPKAEEKKLQKFGQMVTDLMIFNPCCKYGTPLQ